MDLLVVVDMVKGFVDHGALADKNIYRIVDGIVDKINLFLEKQEPIVAFKDTHEENDIEFESFPPHCIRGTSECELVDKIANFEDKMIVIEKPTTNGFVTKEFQEYIKSHTFDNITITGCCTDICIFNFAKSLKEYLTKNNLNTKILIYKNLVDTFNTPNHDAETINIEYLKKMENIGVLVVDNEHQM